MKGSGKLNRIIQELINFTGFVNGSPRCLVTENMPYLEQTSEASRHCVIVLHDWSYGCLHYLAFPAIDGGFQQGEQRLSHKRLKITNDLTKVIHSNAVGKDVAKR